MTEQTNKPNEAQQESVPVSDKVTDKQLNFIMQLQDDLHDFITAEAFLKEEQKENISDLTKREASKLIDKLLARKGAIEWWVIDFAVFTATTSLSNMNIANIGSVPPVAHGICSEHIGKTAKRRLAFRN